MSVSLSHLRLEPGDSLRVQVGETMYQLRPNHEGNKLRVTYYGEGDVEDVYEDQEAADHVIRIAAQRHKCMVSAIKGHDRRACVMAAKREVVTALREKGWSLPMIGRALGKHHTSVLYLLKRSA